MDENYELLELSRDGRKVKFRVGKFEPEIGDYLLSDSGELHKIETAGHRSTPDERCSILKLPRSPASSEEFILK